MRNFLSLAAALLTLCFAVTGNAASTINPAQPTQGIPYSAGPIRNNFQAAASDINALQSMNAGVTAPSNPNLGYLWLQTPQNATVYTLNWWDGTKWVPIGALDTVNHAWQPPVGGGVPGSLLSATTTDIGSIPQAFLYVTGSNTIQSLGASAPVGAIKFLDFTGSPTLTYNATSLILPNAANFIPAPGDVLVVEQSAPGNWLTLSYNRALNSSVSVVANTTALEAAPTASYPNGVIRLTDGTQGAPPLLFQPSNSACTLDGGAGDVGSQVPGFVSGTCWIAAPQTVEDYREWGVGSLNMYVASNGSDTGNFCLISAIPCATLQHAVSQMANFRFLGNTNNASINIATPASYAGATIAGHFWNSSGANPEPCLFIVGTGDSTSSTPTHITSTATNGNIEVSGNACVVIKNMDFPIIGNGVGIFTQDGGSHVLLAGDVSCTGPSSGTEAQACGHAEGGAYIEVTGPNPQITMQGDFAWLFTIGGTPGKLTFDPGANGVLSCGTGLTLDPAGGSFLEEGQSAVVLASGWSWASNCTGITGHPVVAQNNSTFTNQSGTPLPNVGSFRLFDNSVYSPNPVPEVSACTNGAVVNTTGINPSNNSFQIAFTGASSTCTVEFGSVLTGQYWFTNQPICNATMGSGAATKYIVLNYPTNGVTIIPSSPFGTDDSVSVNCSAPTEG